MRPQGHRGSPCSSRARPSPTSYPYEVCPRGVVYSRRVIRGVAGPEERGDPFSAPCPRPHPHVSAHTLTATRVGRWPRMPDFLDPGRGSYSPSGGHPRRRPGACGQGRPSRCLQTAFQRRGATYPPSGPKMRPGGVQWPPRAIPGFGARFSDSESQHPPAGKIQERTPSRRNALRHAGGEGGRSSGGYAASRIV